MLLNFSDQTRTGGSIGLELTGALHRPFMFYWDRLYLEEVAKAGITMHLYERYVDDSQQLAEMKNGEEKETIKKLHEIANNIVKGITMTVDLPENFEDKSYQSST